jgi:uncharacterized protein (DUF302 family)
MSYTFGVTVPRSYEETVPATRDALAEQGFGVLTEIDMAATLRTKLDVDVPKMVILGACRPPLAHRAITVEPSIAAVLPCNVVVRELEDGTTRVEAFDPDVMMGMADSPVLQEVAADARERLTAALATLG